MVEVPAISDLQRNCTGPLTVKNHWAIIQALTRQDSNPASEVILVP